MLVSQEIRGSLSQKVGGELPLTKAFKKFYNSPEVLCFMTPLPSTRSEPYAKPDSNGPHSSGKSKGKGKSKNGSQNQGSSVNNTPTIRELLSSMPDTCSSKLPNGKWLCVLFNRGLCKRQKKGQCHLGLHQCYYKGCTEKKPYIECKH